MVFGIQWCPFGGRQAALKIGKEQGLSTDRALAAKVYSAAHADPHSEKIVRGSARDANAPQVFCAQLANTAVYPLGPRLLLGIIHWK